VLLVMKNRRAIKYSELRGILGDTNLLRTTVHKLKVLGFIEVKEFNNERIITVNSSWMRILKLK